jgi:hypothetical protein
MKSLLSRTIRRSMVVHAFVAGNRVSACGLVFCLLTTSVGAQGVSEPRHSAWTIAAVYGWVSARDPSQVSDLVRDRGLDVEVPSECGYGEGPLVGYACTGPISYPQESHASRGWLLSVKRTVKGPVAIELARASEPGYDVDGHCSVYSSPTCSAMGAEFLSFSFRGNSTAALGTLGMGPFDVAVGPAQMRGHWGDQSRSTTGVWYDVTLRLSSHTIGRIQCRAYPRVSPDSRLLGQVNPSMVFAGLGLAVHPRL